MNCKVIISLLLLLISIASATNYSLVTGWYKGRNSYYYDFGTTGVNVINGLVNPIPLYSLVTGYDSGGNPIPVAGQHNIANITKGEEGYCDLWQIVYFTVGSGYVANTYTSQAQVMTAIGSTAKTGPLVNCPVVDEGSLLADGTTTVNGWVRGSPMYYFDFGPSPDDIIPLYKIPSSVGQHNLIDAVPEDGNEYSPFWEIYFITPPSGYVANTYKSFADVIAAGVTPVDQNMVVNCPVVKTDPVPSSDASTSIISLFMIITLAIAMF